MAEVVWYRNRPPATSLSEFPLRGRVVREYRDPGVREIPAGKSYRLIYRPEGRIINVIAFIHIARDLASLMNEE